ncbi:MAG: D-2-hydroxyacid dehydrogenase family protein [Burkholderiaceae bacterium]
MKIAILDDYQDCVRGLDCFGLLSDHEVKVFNNSARGTGQLAVRLAPFDALVLIRERTTLSAALLARLPQLKLISQTGKVSGHIDVAAATARGIAIAEGVDDPSAAAELTWALIMAARRKIAPYASYLKAGRWQVAAQAPQHNQLGMLLQGQTLGIWGYGKIGRRIAAYGKAFGMTVQIWGRADSRLAAVRDGFLEAESKAEFFSSSDVISLHLRLNDITAACVDAVDLALMKPDALFVNTSRAELVAPGALLEALQAGRPGAAALDVFENEPLPPDSPLLRMENVLATPHLGYVERNSYELYFGAAFQNVLDFAQGKPNNILNPQALQQR